MSELRCTNRTYVLIEQMFEKKYIPKALNQGLRQRTMEIKEMALVTAPAALPKQANRPNHLVLVQDYPQKPVKQPIRLTRRGRRVVALLALIPIAVTFLLIGMRSVQASDASAAAMNTVIVVKPGQSLWDVATSINPTKDPRETIWIIQQLNSMGTSEVMAGQELIVPNN